MTDEYEDDSEREESFWSQLTSEDADIDLKVIVPTGYVIAVDRLNPSRILWQQKVCGKCIAFQSAVLLQS